MVICVSVSNIYAFSLNCYCCRFTDCTNQPFTAEVVQSLTDENYSSNLVHIKSNSSCDNLLMIMYCGLYYKISFVQNLSDVF